MSPRIYYFRKIFLSRLMRYMDIGKLITLPAPAASPPLNGAYCTNSVCVNRNTTSTKTKRTVLYICTERRSIVSGFGWIRRSPDQCKIGDCPFLPPRQRPDEKICRMKVRIIHGQIPFSFLVDEGQCRIYAVGKVTGYYAQGADIVTKSTYLGRSTVIKAPNG